MQDPGLRAPALAHAGSLLGPILANMRPRRHPEALHAPKDAPLTAAPIMQLEEQLAKFMGTDEAIIYSYDIATVSSIIPAFANRKDVLILDEVRGCGGVGAWWELDAMRVGAQKPRALCAPLFFAAPLRSRSIPHSLLAALLLFLQPWDGHA